MLEPISDIPRLAAAVLMTGLAFGQGEQAPPKVPLHFEVADIRQNKVNGDIKADFLPGGRVNVRNVPLKWIIAAVYKTPSNLIVGPGWLESTNFDIVAKAAPTTTRDELYEMTRTLLVERFKMIIHNDRKTVPVWTLIADKKRARLTPSAASTQFGCLSANAAPGSKDPPGTIHRMCVGATMSDLAQVLPLLASSYMEGLPVVDLTGIEGKFDFPLDWMNRGSYDRAVAVNQGFAPNDGVTLTIFDALERLGLRLETRKHSMDSIVVDNIERVPTEN